MSQFSLIQIKNALNNVKSGADFPTYIQQIKSLGVTSYDSFVADGHSDYYGKGDHQVSSTALYEPIAIASSANLYQFKKDLKSHQQGQTDYLTFCAACGKNGIQRWQVSIEKMSCTYFDRLDGQILVEQIPAT